MTDARRFDGDPDAYVVYPVTDRDGGNVDWGSPQVIATSNRTHVEVTLASTWLGSAATTRNLKVPVSTLPVGSHRLRLVVPSDNDVALGNVVIGA